MHSLAQADPTTQLNKNMEQLLQKSAKLRSLADQIQEDEQSDKRHLVSISI